MYSTIRLAISALVAWVFYFTWTYWANGLVSDDSQLVLRSALVQGSLSASITLIFTLTLEKVTQHFGHHKLSLVFVVPILCSVYAKTKQNIAIFNTFNHAVNRTATRLQATHISGYLLAPLLPVFIQGSIALGVNLLNQTPNLLLTIMPSILFSAVYGYMYTYTILRHQQPSPMECDELPR